MKKPWNAEKKQKLAAILAAVLFLLIFAALTVFCGRPLIAAAEDPETFRTFIQSTGIWSRLIFIGIMALQTVVALIPGEPLEIAAGYCFGGMEGLLLCLAGTAFGSALVLLFAKKWGVRWVEIFVPQEKLENLAFLKKEKRLQAVVFLLFLIPGTPKDLLTYFVGLTPLRLQSFLIITTIARIPSVITSTMSGSALGSEKYLTALLVLGITAIVSLIGIGIYRRFIQNKRESS